MILGPLAGLSVTVIVASYAVHMTLIVLAPLNLFFLWRGYRIHRHRLGLWVGGAGVLFISSHMIGHFGVFNWLVGDMEPFSIDPSTAFPSRWVLAHMPIWAGSVLLGVSNFFDIRARWISRSQIADCRTPDEYWFKVLTGIHPGLRESRWVLSVIPSPPRCKLCSAPFAGPGGPLMRWIGRAQSVKNPQFCTTCLSRAPIGGAEVNVSLLFADVRGSTELAEKATPADFSRLMRRFYEMATKVLTEQDALIDKFVGDEVVALFLPAFAGPDHSAAAIEAAKRLLAAAGYSRGEYPWLSIGIGVHTGVAYVGLLGVEGGVTDLTALGDTVNVAKSLSSSASAGELAVSREALVAAHIDPEEAGCKRLQIKGRTMPVEAALLRVGAERDSAVFLR
ncbi:MAG: adenylate/guanylate cyclase domain-containing protein [Actinobacteria bacterium]|nr:adenylate/guanylate cyclase domain-containing protein [Actinomycetota bacterium]